MAIILLYIYVESENWISFIFLSESRKNRHC